jgi:hypothetical protein
MSKGKGGKEMKMMTLRQHYQLFGSHLRGAEDIGVSTNSYALWLIGVYKPEWESIQKLLKRGVSIRNFPD